MTVDGIVSGLPTESIITQLMALERQPQDQLKARRATAETSLTALKGVETKLNAVMAAASTLERASDWTLRTATSSDPSSASVSAAANSAMGSFSFTVGATATAHGLATATNVPAADSIVASGGSLTITVGGTPHVLSVGGGSLTEVTTAINDANLGIRAAAVNTGSGFRLQLNATTTGDASVFTIDSGLDPGVGGTVITNQGGNASITLGTGPGAYSVTSATNSFSNIIPGVTIVARAKTTTLVQVDISADADAIADKISKLVDAVNAAMNDIKAKTAYDTKTKTAGALLGDAAVRQLSQAVTSALANAVGQSSFKSPGLVGVSLDRTGLASFDNQKFLDAFAKDPAGVQRMFVQGATTTGSVKFIGASDATRTGTAAVEVTSLASKATVSGLASGWPLAVPGPITVRIGQRTATYNVTPTDTAADAVVGLQAAIDAAGLAVDVTESGGGLQAAARSVGSAGGFDVAWDGTNFAAAIGTDVAGTIDGAAATAVGQVLTAPATQQLFGGLSVQTDGTTLGPIGTVSYEPGLAQRLAQAIAKATDSTNGYLTVAEKNRQTRMDNLDTAIAAFDVRLAAREATLRKQYTAMEVTLGNLKNQSAYLTSQFSGTAASSSSSSSSSSS